MIHWFVCFTHAWYMWAWVIYKKSSKTKLHLDAVKNGCEIKPGALPLIFTFNQWAIKVITFRWIMVKMRNGHYVCIHLVYLTSTIYCQLMHASSARPARLCKLTCPQTCIDEHKLHAKVGCGLGHKKSKIQCFGSLVLRLSSHLNEKLKWWKAGQGLGFFVFW